MFHDGLGQLVDVRHALTWYPSDVWLWLLACGWRRVGQEEAFVGRAVEVGDALGARVVAARLVRELMRLVFLIERRYAPYSRWLGIAFRQLEAAATLDGPLLAALDSEEDGLVAALEEVARRHNAVGVTRKVEPSVRPFPGRPFRVIGGDRFVQVCLARVQDPWLHSLPLAGSVDQAADSTDFVACPRRARRLRHVYVSDED